MNAITVWQPWAWAIAHAGKDVENRMWPPPASVIARPLAIHAGLRVDASAVLHLRECGFDIDAQHFWRGAVIAVAILGGAIGPYSDGAARGWHERGCWGWRLVNVRTLREPVRCRGNQGVWQLPPNIEAAVLAKLERGVA
jgi:hypothetical protein